MLPLVIVNAVLACALAAFLCVIWMVGNRVRKMEGDLARRVAAMEAALREMASEIEEQRSISAARVPAASLNLNRRSQALAMLRRQETPEAVAAALEIPVAEVQLLMKVHDSMPLTLSS